MEVKTILREQMQAMHTTLEAAITDCTAEALIWKLSGSTINSAGAIYAHTIFLYIRLPYGPHCSNMPQNISGYHVR